MLELRLSSDARHLASMRDAVQRECARAHAEPAHADEVVFVIEQLVAAEPAPKPGRFHLRPRADEVFVVVTVQSDATMLIVRDGRPERAGLGERRRRLLQEHTSGWSTTAGRDGRTVWAEIGRPPHATLDKAALDQAARDNAARDNAVRPNEPGGQTTSTSSPSCTAPPVVITA